MVDLVDIFIQVLNINAIQANKQKRNRQQLKFNQLFGSLFSALGHIKFNINLIIDFLYKLFHFILTNISCRLEMVKFL